MLDLKNKTIVITGAASGNGYGIAEYCLNFFNRVIIIDKQEELLNRAFNNFSKKKKSIVKSFCGDLSNYSERVEIANFINNLEGAVHTFVNNAGISIPKASTLDENMEIWSKTIEINLTAPYHLTSLVIPKISDNEGSIINITSLNSKFSFPNNPSYMASKGGLKQLTLSLAHDLASRGIRVNAVAPGYMKTLMTEKSWDNPVLRKQREDNTMLGRWGYPSDLGGIICFLGSNMSSYITGQEIYVDGGWSTKGL